MLKKMIGFSMHNSSVVLITTNWCKYCFKIYNHECYYLSHFRQWLLYLYKYVLYETSHHLLNWLPSFCLCLQMEITLEPDPDNEGTKISVSSVHFLLFDSDYQLSSEKGALHLICFEDNPKVIEETDKHLFYLFSFYLCESRRWKSRATTSRISSKSPGSARMTRVFTSAGWHGQTMGKLWSTKPRLGWGSTAPAGLIDQHCPWRSHPPSILPTRSHESPALL